MSVSDLENWNPMAEDYSSKNFNSYNSEQSQVNLDPCSLYIKSVPGYLSQDSFQSKFSEFGRIVRFRLYPPRPNCDVTCGLVTYETPPEAEKAISELHRRPPLNLEVNYANAKANNVTLKDVNMNLTKKDQRANLNDSKTLGRGRGQAIQFEKVSPLKIKIDGNRRVTTAYSRNENKDDVTLSNIPKIPELIPNPNFLCLACKKPGEFSCGACKRPYCSTACQVENWNHHKSICETFSEKKENGAHQNPCKYDTGYMSECSNNSDIEKKTVNNKITDVIANRMQNVPSTRLSSVKSPEPIGSRQGAFHIRSPKAFGSSKNESDRKLTFIKSNEIEDSSLPLNRDEKVYVCNFQSPSKLWLHLKTARSVLSEMEKRLNDVVDKSAVTCAVNDVCCTLQDGVFRRIKVTEIRPNAVTAEFIDFGGTSSVQNNLIYHLPLTFRKYSSQAICCKLVDDDGRVNTQWNDEDFTSFHQYTKDKEYKVKAYRCYNNVYDVSLVNEEGVSLYFIIAQSHLESFPENENPSVSLISRIPSVCSNLKEGMEVDIKSIEFDKDAFWGILKDGSGFDKCLTDLAIILEKVETEVINMSCEEGDVAIGYSPSFEEYYRCVILKRLRSSFLVRYIDFGNKEEITQLHSVTPPLLQIRSYVVCCKKPDSLSFENFQKAFENTVNLPVTSVKKSVVELSFTYEGRPLILQCFPWDHGISAHCSQPPTCKIQEQAGTSFKSNASNSRPSKEDVKSNEDAFCKPLKQISPGAQSLVNKAGGNILKTPVKVMKDSISDKNLTVGNKYNVNISFMKTVSEIYVQFTEDKQHIVSLLQQINLYCSTDTHPKYSPVKDEVVCCIFSEDNNWYRAQVLEKAGENKFKVLFIDFGNEDIVSDVNMKPLPQKFAGMKLSACVSLLNVRNEDVSNILPMLLEESWVMEVKDASKCAKVMLFHGQKSLLELINVKTKFPKSSLKFQKLPSNAVSEVEICFADEKYLYFQQTKDLKAIKVLQEKINSGDSKELAYVPEINNVYCCRFENIWYRACVQNEVSPNTFRVNFIDFGNDENVSLKDFKEISSELFGLPVYCIPAEADTVNKELLQPETSYLVQVIGEKAGIPKVEFPKLLDSQQNVCLSSLEKLTFKNGINEVIFVHSENGVYYCQLMENIESFTEMSKKLQTAELKPLVKTPQVEEVVCAKSSDGCWYRASLQAVHNSNYKVFFIDYGNSELVAAENVKFLPNDLLKYPISIPVRIKNITKVEMVLNSMFSLKAGSFAPDGYQFVEIILSGNKDLPNISSLKNNLMPVDKEVEVTFCYLENNVYYAHMTSSQESIESLQVELKNAATFEDLLDFPKEGDVICAKFTDGIWYRGSVKNVDNDQKSCQIFFIDYGNSEAIDFKDLKILPTQLCEIPILALPMKFVNNTELEKQLLANVSVFKIKFVKKSPDNIMIVELVLPEDDIVSSSIETQLLPESLTEVVVVYKEGEILYVQKDSDLVCLQDIMINLQNDTTRKTINSPKVGQLVCVKFHDDGNLYRGLIKEKCGNNFKAFFVDYGNTDTVTEIFSLPTKYSSFPMFSIPVIISNEEILASPLNIESRCKVKYTGKMKDGVQVVRVCPPVDHLLLSSIKTSSLERGSSDVYFHSFDGQFYFVSKVTDITKLNEMKSIMSNFTENEIYHVPTVEEVLIVKFEEIWYRGCVRRTDETEQKCEVFLIDLGSTKTIPFSNMSYIPKSISSFPMFLNKVSLSSSDPLKSPILFGKCYTITVVEHSTDVPIIKVLQPVMFTSIERKSLPLNEERKVMFFHKENEIMFLQDLNDAVPINEMQIEAGECASSKVISHGPIVGELLCAQSDSDGAWYRCCIEEIVDADKYKIHYIDYGNSEEVSKKNLRYLSSNLSIYPSFGIAVKIMDQLPVELEKPYSVIAVSEPVNNIQFVKLLLEEKVCSEPVVEIMSKDDPTLQFLYSSSKRVQFKSGEQDVAIYSVVGDCEACAIFCTPYIQKDIETNREMTEEMTKYCNSLNCSSYNGESLPVSDEMVLAKFDDNQKWNRAVVTECNHPFYDVVFVDCGKFQTLHKDFMRKMEKKFMSLPIQAAVCNLKGFKAIGEDMTNINEEIGNFTIFINPEPLKAVLSVNDADNEDVDIEIPVITNYLVRKGLATVDRS